MTTDRWEARLDAGRAVGNCSFHGHAAVDESAEAQRQTRLAVGLAKAGDKEALCFLYATYSHNIYGYVRSIVRDDHEAEDVTQDVFAKLMVVIVKYDDRGVPFFGWLARLARNTAIDHMRANRATPHEYVHDPDVAGDGGWDSALTVREALASLSDDQREVVLLRHIAGLSPPEIAARMGRSEGSIHGLHHRGRRALRDELLKMRSTPSTQRYGRPAARAAVADRAA